MTMTSIPLIAFAVMVILLMVFTLTLSAAILKNSKRWAVACAVSGALLATGTVLLVQKTASDQAVEMRANQLEHG